MTDQDVARALLAGTDQYFGSQYHDAGSCWRLIDVIVLEAQQEIERLQIETAAMQGDPDTEEWADELRARMGV
jgi:hypothetical protein